MPRRRDDDDYEDDDYDDRPRRRPRPAGGMPAGLVMGAVTVPLLLVGVLLIVLLGERRQAEAPAVAPPPVVAQAPPQNLPRVIPPAPPPAEEPPVPFVPERPAPAPVVANPAEPPKSGPGVRLTGFESPDQLVFGGSPADGSVGVVSYRRMGVGYRIDVAKTATGKPVGAVEIDTASVNAYALTADGSRLAVLGSAPGDGHPVAVYSVADGKQLGRFTPYPRGGPNSYKLPELVWVTFLAADKLLTLTSSGGFDVWSVPGLKRLSGVPSGEPGNYTRLAVNGFTHTPTNFALTPDNKTLAVLNGKGFSFYDLSTGRETAVTDPFTTPGSPATFYGTAFHPDGRRLACFCSLSASGQRLTAVGVWDAKTGQRLSLALLKDAAPSAAGLAWWGPNHLALWQGGMGSADVMAVDTGAVVASVRVETGGKTAAVPPDGRLWAVTPGGLLDRTKTGPRLVAADLPAEFIPRTIFDLGPNGLKAK